MGAYTCDADRLITFNPQAVELEGRAPALNGNRPLMRSAWRTPPVDTPRCEIVLPRAAYVVGAILLGGYVVYWLRDVLTPIFLAFSLPLRPPGGPARSLEGAARPAGIAIVLVGTLGAVALFLGLVVPGVAADVAG